MTSVVAAPLPIKDAIKRKHSNATTMVMIMNPTPALPSVIGAGENDKKRRKVGEGTFGDVFRHSLPQLANQVVIKEMSRYEPESTSETTNNNKSKSYTNEFNAVALREANWLRILKHPNVMRRYEVPYLTETTINCPIENGGITLEKWIQEDVLTKTNARLAAFEYIAFQLLQACRYIHSIGLIHGDLKPRNILIQPDKCKITVIDFGTAIADRLLCAQSFCTHSYRAPELFPRETTTHQHPNRYHSIHFAPSVDVFSLGVILLELVMGIMPLVNTENMQQHLAALKSNQEHLPLIDQPTWHKHFMPARNRPLMHFYNQVWRMTALRAENRPSIDELLKHQIFNSVRSKWATECCGEKFAWASKPSFPREIIDTISNLRPVWLKVYYFEEKGNIIINRDFRTQLWEQLFEFCTLRKCLALFSLGIYLFDQYFSIVQATSVNLVIRSAYICLVIANDILDYNSLNLYQIGSELKHLTVSGPAAAAPAVPSGNQLAVATNAVVEGKDNVVDEAIPLGTASAAAKKRRVPINILQDRYGDIVEKLRFQLYFRMFDHLLLNSRIMSRAQMQYTVTGNINYNLVKQICLDVPNFLQQTQEQLVQKYLQLETSSTSL